MLKEVYSASELEQQLSERRPARQARQTKECDDHEWRVALVLDVAPPVNVWACSKCGVTKSGTKPS